MGSESYPALIIALKDKRWKIFSVIYIAITIFLGYKSCSDGSMPAKGLVYNSSWDGSVRQVKNYLANNLNDPGFDVIEWGKVVRKDNGGYLVRVKYRTRNSFGGYVIEHKVFHFNSSGSIINVVDWWQ